MLDPHLRELLRQRARHLARPALDVTSPKEHSVDLLFFEVAGERFALDADAVLAVTQGSVPEALPFGPPNYRGVIAHRGQILPVLDLGQLLYGTATGEPGRWCIVLGRHGAELGLLVDSLASIRPVAIQSVLRDGLPRQVEASPFVRGIFEGRCLVLEAKTLLLPPTPTLQETP